MQREEFAQNGTKNQGQEKESMQAQLRVVNGRVSLEVYAKIAPGKWRLNDIYLMALMILW